jgi:ATP-dependent DNA helicase Rep
MYVGITRAQHTLNISYCERRKQAREFVPCEPSRFIAEMGSDDIRLAGGNANAVVDKATSKARFAGCFDILAGNKR